MVDVNTLLKWTLHGNPRHTRGTPNLDVHTPKGTLIAASSATLNVPTMSVRHGYTVPKLKSECPGTSVTASSSRGTVSPEHRP